MLLSTESFRPGSVIGSRYRVKSRLGAGGMGWVLEVEDMALDGHEAALKLLYPHLLQDNTAIARFRNEVSLARRLSHPSIVQTFGSGTTEDGIPYVVMEYVPGSTLKAVIGPAPGTLAVDRVETLVLICDALRFAHEKGVVHRDIKPENVLLTAHGRVKLADFGLAQFLREESAFTRTGKVVGTPFYMSPEQIRGEPLCSSSDIYSFGILAYETMMGAPPFEGSSFFVVAEQHLHSSLPPLDRRRCPEWLSDLIRACTAKAPEDRPGSMKEVLAEFSCRRPEALSSLPALPSTAALTEIDAAAAHVSGVQRRGWMVPLCAFILSLAAFFGFIWANPTANRYAAIPVFRAERKLGRNLPLLEALFSTDSSYGDPAALFARRCYMAWPLIVSGMDPNTREPGTENTVLHSFAESDATREMGGYLDELDDILLHGIDVNAKNKAGFTALQLGVMNQRYGTVFRLLTSGADPNIPAPDGWTPLARAVHMRVPALRKMLLLHGADPGQRISGSRTALHIAADNFDIDAANHLILRGADPDAQDAGGQTPLITALRAGAGPLGNIRIIELLAAKTSLELRDHSGRGAADYAQHDPRLSTLVAAGREQ